MGKSFASATLLVLASLVVEPWGAGPATAGEPEPMVREIFVPREDLEILLENQPRRVLLSRGEYEKLREKARRAPPLHAPAEAILSSADYTVSVEQRRARLVGRFDVEVLEKGLIALPIELAGVGLRRATLDDKPAALASGDGGRLTLFVEGMGLHVLTLEMVAPVETTAARQQLSVHLPKVPAARMHLTVPGDVEVKSGAAVAGRQVDAKAGLTRFELLPPAGPMTLVMTLNSRLLRRQRVVVARSVLVDEVTGAYERIHATVSMEVLHRAVERFRFLVPAGFEVTDVRCPTLAVWAERRDADRRVLEVRLRQPATETVVLNLSAVRTGPPPKDWSLARLVPLEVVGQSAVIGLLVDRGLKAESIAGEGLIPIDTQVLRRAIPATVFQAAAGAPPIRPVAAWYAPGESFQVTARFHKPPARVAATTNVLVILEEDGQRAQGGFLLEPEVDKLFAVDFSVPAGWHVTTVSGPDKKPLDFHRHGPPRVAGQIHVRLPRAVAPGGQYRLYFQAEAMPPGWLGDWTTTKIELPVFALAGDVRDVGAVAVDARDDMTVRPDALRRLTLLDEDEKQQYLPGVRTDLAYRYEGRPYGATLSVARTAPRLTARTFSFLRVEPDALVCHYEIAYTVEEARTRKLSLLLPAQTPAALSIRGLDGVALKEFAATTADGQRRWDVLLAEPRRDRVRLAVDFQQPLAVEAHQGLVLPLVRAAGVVWQSGLVAVEGSAELEVAVDRGEDFRRVDVGELVDAEYRPGRRVLGAFGFVGLPGQVKIDVTRPPQHALYPVIVQRAELLSRLSAAGICQTAAQFRLRSKTPFLEVRLPRGARLWSADIDRKPIKPQKQRDALLVSLPATDSAREVTLRLLYESDVDGVGLQGRIALDGPTLWLREEGGGRGVAVPVADLQWRLDPPPGYVVVDSSGTVAPAPGRPRPALFHVARQTLVILGASPLLPAIHEAREVASLPRPYHVREEAQYEGAEMPTAGVTMDALVEVEKNGRRERLRESEGEELGAMKEADAASRKLMVKAAEAPAETAAVATKQPPVAGKPFRTQLYARRLRGLRSLLIELEQGPEGAPNEAVFQGLDGSPRLVVALADRPRFDRLGWAVGLLTFLVGLAITDRRRRTRIQFLLLVVVVGTLLPLVPGLKATLGPADAAVYAAGLLVPYYFLAGLVRWLVGLFGRRGRPAVAAATAAILLGTLASGPLEAAQPPVKLGPYTIELTTPPAAVTVPDDALILPYDPQSKTGIEDADRVLVPYAKYEELWNRAYPDKSLTARKPPAEFALAGAEYSTTLRGDGDLALEGRITVDVYTDGPVTVPLTLGGGVLVAATLDGKPARLSVARPDRRPPPGPRQQAVPQAESRQGPAAGLPAALVLLHVEGRRRHELRLSLRTRLDRRGGWRVAQATLPAAPAAALVLTVPQAETELRLAGVADRGEYETSQPNQRIETALAKGGTFHVEWRAKVAQAQVDRGLTAHSEALVDVREDGLRVEWNLELEFRRGQQEAFSLVVPPGYLVEKVEGTNVRGWEVQQADDAQTVRVTLLQAAKDGEHFTLRMSRPAPKASQAWGEFDAPAVRVAGAALHDGRLLIRRSPMLDLRTVSVSGATRTDLAQPKPTAAAPESGMAESPLGIRPYQAFRFAADRYAIRLAAAPVSARVNANVQSVLRISPFDRTLETRVALDVAGRPIFLVSLLLPVGFQLDEVSAPGSFEWAVTDQDGRPRLSIYLAGGEEDDVEIVVHGALPRQPEGEDLPLPNIHLLDVRRQQGDIAVQVDPAVAVTARDLTGCEEVLRQRLRSWLAPKQQQAAALGLHWRRPDYAGRLRFRPRRPDVHCDTITNVRITDRSVEETILLDFTIRGAGIGEVAFLLPSWMADCRIEAPMLRQKTIEPAAPGDGAPIRVRLELQDEVIGQYRVLVENDRLLRPENDYQASIPTLEKGDRVDEFTVRRFVAMESSGRDQYFIDEDKLVGLESLSRNARDWAKLKAVLGDRIKEAFLVRSDQPQPRLVFRTHQRKALEMAGARIGLAETRLVLDAAGAYRAEQVYWIDNRTEQYVDVQLPSGASLWTAQLWDHSGWMAHASGAPVAGQPLKPTEVPSAAAGWIRIPLVKTAEGDLDSVLRLQYGGRVPPLETGRRFELPFLRLKKIKIEKSQVRLFLPEDYWFDFDDTMTRVLDAGDLAAERTAYQTEKAQTLRKVLRTAKNPFAQIRAANNLEMLSQLTSIASGSYQGNARFQREQARQSTILRGARQDIGKLDQTLQQKVVLEGRDRLRRQVQGQTNSLARNVVQGLGTNFNTGRALPAGGETARRFNAQWFDKNRLSNEMAAEDKAITKDAAERLLLADEKRDQAKAPRKSKAAQKKGQGRLGRAPGVSQAATPLAEMKNRPQQGKPASGKQPASQVEQRQQALSRYRARYQRQNAQAVPPPSDRPANAPGAVAGRVEQAKKMAGLISQPAAPGSRRAGGGRAGGGGGFGYAEGLAAGQAGLGGPLPAAGLASLDVAFPTRGRQYLFSTPQGDIKITGRAVSGETLYRGSMLLGVALAALVVLWIVRLGCRGRFDWWLGPRGSTLLILLGVALLIFLPVVALAALVGGVMVKVNRCRRKRAGAKSAA